VNYGKVLHVKLQPMMQKSHHKFFKTRGFPGIPGISGNPGINPYPGKDYLRMYNMGAVTLTWQYGGVERQYKCIK
jgi:hypothetical protein